MRSKVYKVIRERIPDISFDATYLRNYPLTEIITRLNGIQEKAEKLGYTNIGFCDGAWSAYDAPWYDVEGDRLETDKEREKRLELNRREQEYRRQQKAANELKELKMLKDLMAKYPDAVKDEK
jgi:hypothetical protein